MEVKQKTTGIKKEANAIAKDSIVSVILGKNHSEIDAWVDANVTSQVEIRAVIKKILYVMKLILKEKI